jgi:hypothetical protein
VKGHELRDPEAIAKAPVAFLGMATIPSVLAGGCAKDRQLESCLEPPGIIAIYCRVQLERVRMLVTQIWIGALGGADWCNGTQAAANIGPVVIRIARRRDRA